VLFACDGSSTSTDEPRGPVSGEFESLCEQAGAHAREHDFAGGLELIDRALTLRSDDLAARRLRVHCLAGVEAFEELLAECERTIALAAPDAWLFYERGYAREQVGRYDGALDDFTRALALDARHYKALQHRGWVLQLLGRHAAAVDDLSAAIELTPSASERELLLRNRAVSFEMLGRHDDARRDGEAADALLASR
jgi:tetratricopeptide (TPR) repeat protein